MNYKSLVGAARVTIDEDDAIELLKFYHNVKAAMAETKPDQSDNPMKTLRQLEFSMNEIAHEIVSRIPEDACFILILSTVGRDGYSTFGSNIHREDALALIKELLDNIDKNTPTISGIIGTA